MGATAVPLAVIVPVWFTTRFAPMSNLMMVPAGMVSAALTAT